MIYNPTKISDKFRALVEEGLQQKGWGNTLWLETSVEDPGGAITKQSALLPTLWPTPVQLLSRRPRRYRSQFSERMVAFIRPCSRSGGFGRLSTMRKLAIRRVGSVSRPDVHGGLPD